jgi:hypothetical protein
MQVYNVVPPNSPIFEMTESGDVIGTQELFRTRQASPFDRTEGGYTVLDVRVAINLSRKWLSLYCVVSSMFSTVGSL